jgi:integrase
VVLALSTGARRSELVKLKWTDFNLSSESPNIYLKETKNGESRVLPLLGQSLKIARVLHQKAAGKRSCVFPHPDGRDVPFRDFDAHWYRALKAAGIEDFHFHDLRHSFASYLAMEGASLIEVANVLGHRSLRMTLRYAHLTPAYRQTRLTRMVRKKGL